MNEKLTHCCELADLINSHLTDEHHTRLEWMIILLIMVEVIRLSYHNKLTEKYSYYNLYVSITYNIAKLCVILFAGDI